MFFSARLQQNKNKQLVKDLSDQLFLAQYLSLCWMWNRLINRRRLEQTKRLLRLKMRRKRLKKRRILQARWAEALPPTPKVNPPKVVKPKLSPEVLEQYQQYRRQLTQ